MSESVYPGMVSILFLCIQRILGTLNPALPIIEELPDIQCTYFGTKEEFTSLLSPRKCFQMKIPSEI